MKKDKTTKVTSPIIKIKKIKPEPIIPYIVVSTTPDELYFTDN
jgi:hypothetical protein